MDIIISNALAGSGKDTFVKKYLEQHPEAVHMRFKNPIYREMCKRYNLTLDEVLALNSHENKDIPQDVFDGETPRSVCIDISENFIKVNKGSLGVVSEVVEEILDMKEHGRKTFIFSDGGFLDEVMFLKRVLKRFGLKRFTIVGIDNPNVTPLKTTDSRSVFENHDIVLINDAVEDEDVRGAHMYLQFSKFYNA